MDQSGVAEIKDGLQPYELAYLLSPLIAADKVVETIERLLKSALSGVEAEVEREELARMIPLAYPLKRVVENKSSTFREAYWGVIYFRAEPERAASLEANWRQAPELIRYLLLRRSPESLRWQARQSALAVAARANRIDQTETETATEAIDKEIEGMLAI